MAIGCDVLCMSSIYPPELAQCCLPCNYYQLDCGGAPTWLENKCTATIQREHIIVQLPMTSAWSFWAENHESSPNLPSLYLVRSRSFGKPQTTDTRCGRVLLFVSASVENRMAALLINRVVVQQIDCMARIQCHTNTHTQHLMISENYSLCLFCFSLHHHNHS